LTDSEANARKYAFLLLNYRSRSEKELRERLEKKGFSENNISSTLRQLKEAGYLDDHALALDLKRQAFDNKLLGHNSAKRFLLNRGVPDEIIDETLEYNEETEANKIQKLIEKKLRTTGNYADKKKERRLWDFLVRKGYSFSTIRNAFQNFIRIEEEEEENE
jgi:regulatory protein